MKLLEKLVRTKGGVLNEELLKYFKRFGASSSVLPDAEKQYLENKFGKLYISNDDYYRDVEKYIETIPLEVSDILKKYGSDAHLYMPGVGTITGFTTGNYVESTGNTPTVLDDVTGLVLDAAGSVGAELTSLSSWNGGIASFSNGKLTIVNSGGATAYVQQPVLTGSSLNHWITTTVDSISVGSVSLYNQGGSSSSPLVVGKNTGLIRRGSDNNLLIGVPAGCTVVISALSVKEVTGIHASQATTANKPTLRRGILNLLTYSNDLTNAAWSKVNISLTGGQQDPYGGNSAQAISDTATNTQHAFYGGAFTPTVGQSYTEARVVKAGACQYFQIPFDSAGFSGSLYANFNLSTGQVATKSASVSASMLALGNGFYLCVASAVTTSAVWCQRFGAALKTDGAFYPTYVGDGSVAVYHYASGGFAGVLNAMQIMATGGIPLTTTAPASSSSGAYAWQFDGVNDALSLPGPLFQMADDHCIVAAVSKNSVDTNSQGIFAVEGGTTELIGLTFSSAKVQYFLNAGGTATYRVSQADYQSIPTVISGRKIGSAALLRVNGVQQGATLSTSAVGSNAMTGASIGKHAYAGVAAPMNGLIYPIIAIKGTVSDSDLLVLEKWLGSIAGVVI